MPTIYEFERGVAERAFQRIAEIEANPVGPNVVEDIAFLRRQVAFADPGTTLAEETNRIAQLNRPPAAPADALPPPQGLPPPQAVVIGGPNGAAIFERDWSDVFAFFPGTRAQFQEIVVLDAREDELFRDRHDANLRPVWLQVFASVLTLWNPFKSDMVRKLAVLGTPRKFTATLSGIVRDDDNFSDDETNEFTQPFSNTLRFGERLPLLRTWAADTVTMAINLSLRFGVGLTPGDPPILELDGTMALRDGDNDEGNTNVNVRLSHGQTSGLFQIGPDDDDFCRLTVSYEVTP